MGGQVLQYVLHSQTTRPGGITCDWVSCYTKVLMWFRGSVPSWPWALVLADLIGCFSLAYTAICPAPCLCRRASEAQLNLWFHFSMELSVSGVCSCIRSLVLFHIVLLLLLRLCLEELTWSVLICTWMFISVFFLWKQKAERNASMNGKPFKSVTEVKTHNYIY